MAYFKSFDGTEIFYRDQGEGEAIILIHGWPANADMWENQTLALLEAGCRVIAYDRRGFGRSDHGKPVYNYDIFADDLKALIDHLQLDQVALAGFSMGGGEIARYLSRHAAEKISRVALVSSVVPLLQKTEDHPQGVPLEALEQMKQQLRADRHQFLAAFGKDFFGVSLLHHAVSPEVLSWMGQMANMASLKAEIDCVDAFGKTDFRADLASFTIPTLVIHGDGDKTVPFEATGALAAKSIPGSTLLTYEGAPHGLFQTHKDRLSRDLLQFLGVEAHGKDYLESR